MNARWQDLKQRTISGVLLAAAVLFITWWNPVSFNLLLLAAAYQLLREWFQLTRARHDLFFVVGVLYIGLACISLAAIRRIYGWDMIFIVFALVWVGDIAAYFVGKRFGKHKLAPAISPGKSWEGLAGSVIATAALSVWLLAVLVPHTSMVNAALIGVAFAIVGLAGDLFESALKRKAGVKDSGNLIPGHGGLFDRVDALMPCSILAAFLLFA